MSNVIIVGGGASGLVTAIFAKNKYNKVTILEKNSSCLKKLLLTGNGKCNYFNEVYSLNNYHSTNLDIVNNIISTNNINRCREFFDGLGIIPKIKNGYYYPFSNQASTIKNVLLLEARNRGIDIINNVIVNDIKKSESKFIIYTDTCQYSSDVVVLACGSYAYPKTGSDGAGYTFLKSFNHNIVEPLPALVQLVSNFKYQKKWSGVRTDVELSLFEDGEYIAREIGELQLTDYGISGICTFNLSNYVTRGLFNKKKEIIKINFVPFIETLITPWFDAYSKKNYYKNIRELLESFLNYKVVDVILKTVEISGDSMYSDLSNHDKLKLCKYLRSFPLEIIDTKGFDFCQICNGGVCLEEINQNTMESNLISGLYVVGELLDINGNCGGYNLTSCWITGMLAGTSIGEKYD